jgi:hypothetical protein
VLSVLNRVHRLGLSRFRPSDCHQVAPGSHALHRNGARLVRGFTRRPPNAVTPQLPASRSSTWTR